MYKRPLVGLLGLVLLLSTGCISIPLGGMGRDRGKVHAEEIKPADGLWTRDEVLMLPLSGMVREGSDDVYFGEPGMLVSLKDRLLAAKDNPHIKAVVLRIDSPGGTITASDLIYNELVKFKQEKKVPVVAIMGGTAASGGLYIAMAADEIYALPTTITGSIGVIAMFPNISPLASKVGVEMQVMKSGANKDAGAMWHPMTEEQRKIFQSMVDGFYQRFVQVIMTNRSKHGLTSQTLATIADGRILTPDIAARTRLIDGIKYHDDVIARARELAGISDARVISYEYPFFYRGHVYAEGPAVEPRTGGNAGGGDVNLFKLDAGKISEALTAPRFYYMWMP